MNTGASIAMPIAIPSKLAAEGMALRPERHEDKDFLCRLYLSTRWDEMAHVEWTDAEKTNFLRQQFLFQDTHYTNFYTGASRMIVTNGREPAGRLYLLEMPGDLRIVDISLLPEYRGRGIGTSLLRTVMGKAGGLPAKVSIHVERFNPARRLYDRLGFKAVREYGVYDFMEWEPSGSTQ